MRRPLTQLAQRRERVLEGFIDGVLARARSDQELAETDAKSAAVAAPLKRHH